MATTKQALGKGIGSLLKSINDEYKSNSGSLKADVVQQTTSSSRVPMDLITVNPKNPRKAFDDQSLNELADSIKRHDIIQPITVSKLANGKYQIISGERRFRAATIAGLKDIPAYIRKADTSAELLELALLENLQREDLNAMEIGLSYKRMMEELQYTQEQVAERMSKERSTVTNYIRLLKLPPDIQTAVRDKQLSMGHARALISIDLVDKQLFIFNEIKNKNLSVRQTEDLVRKFDKKAGIKTSGAKNALPPAYKRIEDKIASHFGTKAKLNHNKKGEGSITLEYYSLQELNKLLEMMSVQVN